MKNLAFSLIAAAVMCLVSCGSDNGHELSDYTDASTADSLLYYYMQLRAHEYWDHATADTTLRNADKRSRYLDGVRKGLAIAKEDDDSYNDGLKLGLRLATRLRNFEKRYNVDFDDDIILGSLRNGLQDGKDMALLDVQKEFYRLLDEVKDRQRARDSDAARMSLVAEARNHRLTKITDDLYYKIVKKGVGPYVRKGDVAYIAADYQKADGEDLGMPSPELITVGEEGVPEVMDMAYRRLNRGSTAIFATTAGALFGARTSIMELNDPDVIIISLTLNDIIKPSDEDYPGDPVNPATNEDTIRARSLKF